GHGRDVRRALRAVARDADLSARAASKRGARWDRDDARQRLEIDARDIDRGLTGQARPRVGIERATVELAARDDANVTDAGEVRAGGHVDPRGLERRVAGHGHVRERTCSELRELGTHATSLDLLRDHELGVEVELARERGPEPHEPSQRREVERLASRLELEGARAGAEGTVHAP